MNCTDISIVLDRSGSMETVRADTIGGFNTFIKDQQKAKGKAVLSLFQFDDVYEEIYVCRNVKKAPLLDIESYVPRSVTALLDAIGRTINSTDERLKKLKKESRPDKVVFVIITDGLENASREFNRSQIFDMIKKHKKWEFLFLGANQDAIAEGASLGVSKKMSITYLDKNIKHAFTNMSANVVDYRSTGMKTSLAFSEEDRKDAIKK